MLNANIVYKARLGGRWEPKGSLGGVTVERDRRRECELEVNRRVGVEGDRAHEVGGLFLTRPNLAKIKTTKEKYSTNQKGGTQIEVDSTANSKG